MSGFQSLFSVEEALGRLGQSGSPGCLVIFNAKEEARIFVRDGNVIAAQGKEKSGEAALDFALELADSSYRWVPDEAPAEATMRVNIQEYFAARSQTRENRHKTLRMATYQKREKKSDFQYFFVPEEMPATKLRLKKTTSVAGREPGCDVVIDGFQVSRRHCILEVTDRGVLVRDLDSTNGTFINGAPVRDGYLNEGDRLSLGTYGMTLRREKV